MIDEQTDNDAKDEGVISICESLMTNSMLTKLNIGRYNIMIIPEKLKQSNSTLYYQAT